MSSQAQRLGELAARLDAMEHGRVELRADLNRMFEKLEEIHSVVAVLKAAPSCSDPNSCKRMELVLADQNKRLVRMELDRQKLLGERTTIGVVCSIVGVGIGWLIEIFHK